MQRKTFLATVNVTYTELDKLLADGWILDPWLNGGKPYRLDAAMVWPLIKFDSQEEKDAQVKARAEEEKRLGEVAASVYPETEEQRKLGPLEDVCDVITVEPTQVAEKYKQGYRVQEVYAKSVTMIRRAEPAKEEPAEEVKKIE